MDGGFLHTKNDSIKKISIGNQNLALIARAGNIEVMIQEVTQGDMFGISPADSFTNIFEFFYVLSGEAHYLIDEDTFEPYSQGDYFYFVNCKDSYVFEALSDIKLLYLSSVPVFDSMSEEYQELVDMVVKVGEKDIYTKEHSSRVCSISIKLAEYLGLSHESIIKIYYASIFHDVGKIHVDSSILTKPGKLTEEEYNAIKEHVKESVILIEPFKQFDIKNIVVEHHERLDGSGYPNGLKSEDISIEARIIAVADAYDAMTSDRAYRKALSIEVVYDELNKFSGTQFDPAVVKMLIRLVGEGIIK